VSLTIGAPTSFIKWVALKGALTHSAHMMLHVENGKQEDGLQIRKDRRKDEK